MGGLIHALSSASGASKVVRAVGRGTIEGLNDLLSNDILQMDGACRKVEKDLSVVCKGCAIVSIIFIIRTHGSESF